VIVPTRDDDNPFGRAEKSTFELPADAPAGDTTASQPLSLSAVAVHPQMPGATTPTAPEAPGAGTDPVVDCSP
jgi:hypothetical protein